MRSERGGCLLPMDGQGRDAAILVADDDDDDFLLVQKAFRWVEVDVPIYRARDGRELLQMLRREELASRLLLVLMDLNMPVKDGREALREIKSNPKLKRLPVIVLTNSRSEADAILSYELGANSFIYKPF